MSRSAYTDGKARSGYVIVGILEDLRKARSEEEFAHLMNLLGAIASSWTDEDQDFKAAKAKIEARVAIGAKRAGVPGALFKRPKQARYDELAAIIKALRRAGVMDVIETPKDDLSVLEPDADGELEEVLS